MKKGFHAAACTKFSFNLYETLKPSHGLQFKDPDFKQPGPQVDKLVANWPTDQNLLDYSVLGYSV